MSIVYDVVSVTMRLDRDWSVHLFEVIVGPESSGERVLDQFENECSYLDRQDPEMSRKSQACVLSSKYD